MHGLESRAGYVHKILAYATIALAVVHSLAALKHHYIDKNAVLTRMWSGPPTRNHLKKRKIRQ